VLCSAERTIQRDLLAQLEAGDATRMFTLPAIAVPALNGFALALLSLSTLGAAADGTIAHFKINQTLAQFREGVANRAQGLVPFMGKGAQPGCRQLGRNRIPPVSG